MRICPITTDRFSFSCGVPSEITLTDSSPAGIFLNEDVLPPDLIVRTGGGNDQFCFVNTLSGHWPHAPLSITIALGGLSPNAFRLVAVSSNLSARQSVRVRQLHINLIGGKIYLGEMVRAEKAWINMVNATSHLGLSCPDNLELHCVASECMLVWPDFQRGAELSWIGSRVKVHGVHHSGVGKTRYSGTALPMALRVHAVNSRIDLVSSNAESCTECA